jgi:hypothetical protein
MYYLGSPFEPINEITAEAALQRTMYFKEKPEKVPFAHKLIETFTGGQMDLVIYVSAQHTNTALIAYHNEHYGAAMPFHVEEYLGDRTVHTTLFKDLRIHGICIYHYDPDWRLKIEQCYDEQYRLFEYRECYYKAEEPTPFEEKFFFAKNWVIQKEQYKSE